MPPIAATVADLAAWLDTAVNHELRGDFSAIKLERMRRFMRWLPTPPAPCIVAGTKGKGSTARLLEAALIAQGCTTVTFMSPHVVDIRERWRVGGQHADITELAQAANEVALLESKHQTALSWFERTFAMVCLLAIRHAPCHFIIEVGLGGRCDCANVLDAQVAVLTHLSHDHRDVLGPTLEHIAREKMAIARAGRPLIVAPQSEAGRAAILRVFNALPETERPQLQFVDAPTASWDLALLGAHQNDNAATAVAAGRVWLPAFDVERANAAMKQVVVPARCQLLFWRGRRVLLDGAHNGPSVAATMAVAQQQLRPGWHLAIGVAKDKELDEILAALPAGLRVVRVGYASLRARGADDWPSMAQAWPWYEHMGRVLEQHIDDVDLCITGSFYVAGEALAWLQAHDEPQKNRA